jgi:hypothetical protein
MDADDYEDTPLTPAQLRWFWRLAVVLSIGGLWVMWKVLDMALDWLL